MMPIRFGALARYVVEGVGNGLTAESILKNISASPRFNLKRLRIPLLELTALF
jgi:hypothetical protein